MIYVQVIPNLSAYKPSDEYPNDSNLILDVWLHWNRVINMLQTTRCVYIKCTSYYKHLRTLLWTYSFHKTYDNKHMLVYWVIYIYTYVWTTSIEANQPSW